MYKLKNQELYEFRLKYITIKNNCNQLLKDIEKLESNKVNVTEYLKVSSDNNKLKQLIEYKWVFFSSLLTIYQSNEWETSVFYQKLICFILVRFIFLFSFHFSQYIKTRRLKRNRFIFDLHNRTTAFLFFSTKIHSTAP